MCSARDNAALPALGFPIRKSAGQRLFSASPRLIAAVHVLHRLLVPRHPPCALTILTVILGRALRLRPVIPVTLATVQFSRSVERRCDLRPPVTEAKRAAGGRRSLKTQQHVGSSVRARGLKRAACQVRSTFLDSIGKPIETASFRMLPRKEVIQPQLPLRLPCYDFTPVTSPTFDGSLPCGLGHRLRVLLTPVV